MQSYRKRSILLGNIYIKNRVHLNIVGDTGSTGMVEPDDLGGFSNLNDSVILYLIKFVTEFSFSTFIKINKNT